MAQISKPPVPLKMYKHFAAATITLTLAIALFADGSNKAAQAEGSQEQASTAQQGDTEVVRNPQATIARREHHSVGSFGSEVSGDYGAPMDNSGRGVSSAMARPSRSTNRQPLPNVSPEELAAMDQAEYERLRRIYAEAGVIELVDSNALAASSEAASARRMGHSGSDR